ncbi:MAG: CBS domain-containing protein [Deltaproteobacteria bacterium]|nr:CBS domain-containing protein [Deltaproteobacteria bacterium]
MECQEIMNPIKTSLFAEDPASTAIDFMLEKHMGLVPVVDKDGVFVGLLSGDRLMHFMLPRTVSMMRGKKYAGFVRESREELKERLDELRLRTIGELVDRFASVAYPDTGLIDAMIMLSEKQNVIPIVERETKKLVGAISFFTILNKIEEK